MARSRTLRASLVAAVIAGVLVVASQPAATQGWSGFAVDQLPSGSGVDDSPAWGLGITEDLGGAGVDVWNNNHGNMSEAIVDVGGTATTRTAAQSNAPAVAGPDTHGVAFSDIDGDGDEDLLEVSGRNNDNRLFRNDNGELTFVDAGNLIDSFGRGRQPIFFDYDNDGDMDVLITNLDLRSDPVPQDERQLKPSEVYLNNGDGTSWSKVADPNEIITDSHVRIAQLTSTGPGTPNIIVTHDVFTLARDSMAVGVGQMVEPSNPATVRRDTSRPIREVLVGDFDGDLYPEFIVFNGNAGESSGNWPVIAHEVTDAGNARTVNIPVSPSLDNCRSGAAADFDNDGDLDILAGCAQREEGQNRNVVLLNDGQGNFRDAGGPVLPATIAETPGAIVTADINADGWMDAIVGNGYDFDRAVDHVYTNRLGTSAHWLAVDLVGSNPDAMGAVVYAGTDKWQVREMGHRYHRSQDGRTLHFGLGEESRIAPLVVRWADGTYSSCTIAGVDQRVQVVKGSAACATITQAQALATLDAAPATENVLVCNNLVVTVDLGAGDRPTEGDDVIRGTAGDDVINGLGGDDTICGLRGDDRIDGGDGFDKVFAGAGDDTVSGGAGNDLLIGGLGADSITGGDGNDRIQGGDGIDTLGGDNGNDILRGGNDNDTIRGGTGADMIWGNLGRDELFGDAGSDVLRGGAWLDRMDGGAGTNDGCTLTDPNGETEVRIGCEGGVFGR